MSRYVWIELGLIDTLPSVDSFIGIVGGIFRDENISRAFLRQSVELTNIGGMLPGVVVAEVAVVGGWSEVAVVGGRSEVEVEVAGGRSEVVVVGG